MPPLWPDSFDDRFGTRFTFFVAAGRSLHDCAVIGHRFDAETGFRWEESESWLIRVRPTGMEDPPDTRQRPLGGTPWLTRVWMSPAGRFWVTSMEGVVHQETDDGSIRQHPLPALPSGIWGFDDGHVYVWSETAERLFRWDGTRWNEMPCPGRVLVIHGTGPDDLLASGYAGNIWRWNGQAWSGLSLGLEGTVAGLRAAGPDRAYACSLSGEIVEITPYGAQLITRWDGPLLDLTTLDGDLLLAAGVNGLLRLPAGTNVVETVTDDFNPERFDTHEGGVIITTSRGIVETKDGKDFVPGLSAAFLRSERDNEFPLW